MLWTSQLFSLLAIGALIYETADISQPTSASSIPPRSQLFRAAAQCLVFANWERPQPHVVEALFSYVMGKTIASPDFAYDCDEVSNRAHIVFRTLIYLGLGPIWMSSQAGLSTRLSSRTKPNTWN